MQGLPKNPIMQALSLLAFGVVLIGAVLMGAIVLAFVIGFAAVFAVVLWIRIWWVSRKMRKQGGGAGRPKGDSRVIEVEYTVLDDDETDRR